MTLNETMLFRWVGYEIELEKLKGLAAPSWKKLPLVPELDPDKRRRYLGLLRDALDPSKGLRVSGYDAIDQVGRVKPLVNPQPCLFLTEQAASGSADHWRLYGRMGFGFSKRAIFREGGRPVIYSGGKRDALQHAVEILRKHLNSNGSLTVNQALELLVRFIKSTTIPKLTPSDAEAAEKPKAGKIRPIQGQVPSLKDAKPLAFPSEKKIAFLQEREWRLPKPLKPARAWHQDGEGYCWFRPQIGHDLQMVVLPDNETLHMAIACDFIRARLLASNRPPLQLITAELLRKV